MGGRDRSPAPSRESLQRLATGRYSDLVTATIAASSGKVALYACASTDQLMDAGSRQAADDIAAEGYCLVPGDATRSGRVGVTPAELPTALAAFFTDGALGEPLSEDRTPSPQRSMRVLYGITGAIVATCSSAWLESLASARGFEIGITATAAASRMVSVDGLRAVYAHADESGLASSADVVVVSRRPRSSSAASPTAIAPTSCPPPSPPPPRTGSWSFLR